MNLNLDKVLINKVQSFSNCKDIHDSKLCSGYYSLDSYKKPIDFLLFNTEKVLLPRKLFVLFSGARSLSNEPPYFNRWSWYTKFDGLVLNISDPTFYLDESISLGWYLGDAKSNLLKHLVDLIETIQKKFNIKDTILYGSSGGGFASFKIASELNNCLAIAINPQTDILKYHKKFVNEYLKLGYKKDKLDLTYSDLNYFSLFDFSNRTDSNVKYILVQNIQDKFHYDRHYLPFCYYYGLDPVGDIKGSFQTILYNHENGHGGEPKEVFEQLLLIVEQYSSKYISNHLDENKQALINYDDLKGIKPIHLEQIELKASASAGTFDSDTDKFNFIAHGRKDLLPVQMSIPIDWSSNPYDDRNWLAQLNMWRFLDSNFRAYDESGDSSNLAFCYKVILDWHHFHFIMGETTLYTNADMVVGCRAMRLAYLVDIHRRGEYHLNNYQISCLNDLIEMHLDFLMNEDNYAFSNHTLSDIQGLAALKQVVVKKQQILIENFLDNVIDRVIYSQFDDNFIHKENSPEYHFFGIKVFKNLHNTGWFGNKFAKTIEEAEKKKYWFIMPDKGILPFGDSTQQFEKKKTAIYTSDPRYKKIFNESGYLIYKDISSKVATDSSYFAVMGALNSRFHKQSDDFSVVWFEGEDILCDVGKYAYKSDEFRSFAVSTRAHNTVSINNDNYYYSNRISNEQIYGSAVKQAREYDWGFLFCLSLKRKGLAKAKNMGVEQYRYILYSPGKWTFILDNIVSDKPISATQWFHFSPDIKSMNIINEEEVYVKTSLEKSLYVQTTPNVHKVSHCYGLKEPEIQGWISTAYGEMTPAHALGFSKKGNDIYFSTLFNINNRKARLVQRNDRRYILKNVLNKSGQQITLAVQVFKDSCKVTEL